ncbi:MAG: Rrf2 family transcriptional regulator [Candidatus Eiseniibacteriota bacterium]|jgi:Rrf2 family protein
MQLTSQEEYGLRCLLQVARHDGEAPVSIAQIAAAEGISPEYVAKLMRLLRQGGLVESTRGAGGGYRLSSPATQVTVWDAVRVLGNPFFSEGFCTGYPGQLSDCVHTPDCSIRVVWGAVEEALRGVLGKLTLADLTLGEQTASVRFPALIEPAAPGSLTASTTAPGPGADAARRHRHDSETIDGPTTERVHR